MRWVTTAPRKASKQPNKFVEGYSLRTVRFQVVAHVRSQLSHISCVIVLSTAIPYFQAKMSDLRFLPARVKYAIERGVTGTIKRSLKGTTRMIGYDIVRFHSNGEDSNAYPPDFTPLHVSILNQVKPYTLTSPERVYSLVEAVSHLVRRNIQGSFVECGVWRGGSMMAVALALQSMNCTDRDLYLFDTFDGMPKPTSMDIHFTGQAAITEFQQGQTGADSSNLCYASLSDVKATMERTGYNPDLVHFVQGKVEETIPSHAPDSIALLRLDTDFYESTRHELEQLYPRLSPGGILIIDDYWDWQGARKATDEFIAKHAPNLFLNRIDYTGRLAVKTS
jgi:O-methyltransferase